MVKEGKCYWNTNGHVWLVGGKSVIELKHIEISQPTTHGDLVKFEGSDRCCVCQDDLWFTEMSRRYMYFD